jgi:hypothetical protein
MFYGTLGVFISIYKTIPLLDIKKPLPLGEVAQCKTVTERVANHTTNYIFSQ